MIKTKDLVAYLKQIEFVYNSTPASHEAQMEYIEEIIVRLEEYDRLQGGETSKEKYCCEEFAYYVRLKAISFYEDDHESGVSLLISYESDKISYCPFCGVKLKEGK